MQIPVNKQSSRIKPIDRDSIRNKELNKHTHEPLNLLGENQLVKLAEKNGGHVKGIESLQVDSAKIQMVNEEMS